MYFCCGDGSGFHYVQLTWLKAHTCVYTGRESERRRSDSAGWENSRLFVSIHVCSGLAWRNQQSRAKSIRSCYQIKAFWSVTHILICVVPGGQSYCLFPSSQATCAPCGGSEQASDYSNRYLDLKYAAGRFRLNQCGRRLEGKQARPFNITYSCQTL